MVSLGQLTLVLTSLLLKAAFRILIIMFVLWLAGTLWPYVADALGMPYGTLYELYLSVVRIIKDAFGSIHTASPRPTPIPTTIP